MTGFIHVIVPHDDVELVSGRDKLTSYRFGTGAADHLFCRYCGVKSFYQPRSHPDAWSVNARCFDQPVELAIEPFDGAHWEEAKARLDAAESGGYAAPMHRPLRLTVDAKAMAHNWRWLQERARVPAGAAIKADGYGLGARAAMATLHEAGCRTFFVSTYAEAEELGGVPDDVSLVVLHGVGADDADAAMRSIARPVLNSPDQARRWKQIAPGRPCDVMIDTGINRLGLAPDEIGALTGLAIDTLHSHLARADEDSTMNSRQLARFREVAAQVRAKTYSLANSAGICLGSEYSLDLVRPGLALYGGIPRSEARGGIRQVARVEAQVVQRRTIRAGDSCGYGATFAATGDTQAAIVNIGYADGYLRGFSSRGSAFAGEFALPVLGRVSMDLVALGCDAAPDLSEGDWVELDYDLPSASAASGLSQYELLTGLGGRFERVWI